MGSTFLRLDSGDASRGVSLASALMVEFMGGKGWQKKKEFETRI